MEYATECAVKLHRALREITSRYAELLDESNRAPMIGDPPEVLAAQRVLFHCRPMADWEDAANDPRGDFQHELKSICDAQRT